MTHYLVVSPCEHGNPCPDTEHEECPGYGDHSHIECTAAEDANCRWICDNGCETFWIDRSGPVPIDRWISADGEVYGCGQPLTPSPCTVKEYFAAVDLLDVMGEDEQIRVGGHEITTSWEFDYLDAVYTHPLPKDDAR